MADPFESFEVGTRAAQGGNPVASAIKQTLEKIKLYDTQKQEMQMKMQMEQWKSQQELTSGMALEQFKSELGAKRATEQMKSMGELIQGGTGIGQLGVTGMDINAEGQPTIKFGQTPGSKQAMEVGTDLMKKQQEAVIDTKTVNAMVSTVWDAADTYIPPISTDIQKATISGVERNIAASDIGRIMGFNKKEAENVTIFNDFKESTLSEMIRKLGERGMLTDQDIARARQFYPKPGDTAYIRANKKQLMINFLNSKLSAYQSNTQKNIPTFATEQEAETANLPSGTEIIINGRRAIWE